MFAKIANGQIEQYPISLLQLRKQYRNVSFPQNPPPEFLAQFDVYPVVVMPAPEIDARTQRLVTQQPQLIDGVWTVVKAVVPKDQEQIDSEFMKKAVSVREVRNRLLSESDWTQVADSAVDKATWAQYRQELRDVTQQENFPWGVVWPQKPK